MAILVESWVGECEHASPCCSALEPAFRKQAMMRSAITAMPCAISSSRVGVGGVDCEIAKAIAVITTVELASSNMPVMIVCGFVLLQFLGR